MTSFEHPYTNKNPDYKFYVFNTQYSYDNVITNDVDAEYDTRFAGWLKVPDTIVGMMSLKVEDYIDRESSASSSVLTEEIPYFTADIIARSDDVAYLPKSADIQPDSSCKILVFIDSSGISSPDTAGSVTITGTTDENGADDSETLTIDGDGTYVTSKHFSSINTDGIDETDLSDCTISVWGDIGTKRYWRDAQIWVDSDSDGNYGLMFGGIMRMSDTIHRPTYSITKLDFRDYTSFLNNNEYIAGYRAEYRCSHYSKTGAYGDCDTKDSGDASNNWRVTDGCFMGDMDTRHPCDVHTADQYRCLDYNAGSEPLPYDGYTYYENYADSSNQYYQYYPKDIARALKALENMCRKLQESDVIPFEYQLKRKWTARLDGSIDGSVNTVYFKSGSDTGSIEAYDWLLMEDEWMKITYVSGTELSVTRGDLQTQAVSHADNTDMTVYRVFSRDSPLITDNGEDMMFEANISSTIKATGDSIVNVATSRLSNAEYMFWVDYYKNIRVAELYGDNLGSDSGGSSSDLAISEDNVLQVTELEQDDVKNKVSCWVEDDSNNRYYCSLSASETPFTDYGISEHVFGIHEVELQNKQLNAVGYTDLSNGLHGFMDFAENYLKVHAFPRLRQTITVDSFVPDEHYWSDTSTEPYMMYSDEWNEHVDLKGHKVTCPDYQLSDKGYPDRTFVVEGLKYTIPDANNNYKTRIVMSRISTPDDWK